MQQVRVTVLIAFSLGVIFSLFQIFTDYHEERSKLDSTVKQVLGILDQPASHAVYTGNQVIAQELLTGIFDYKAIIEVKLVDDRGLELAQQRGGEEDGPFRWLTDLIFGARRYYQVPLFFQPPPKSFLQMSSLSRVGELQVWVDTYPSGIAFLQRSMRILITGLLRNFLLSLILLVFFHHHLTKPFLRLQADLLAINPKKPEKTRISFPKKKQNDEFAHMVHSTNQLLETIEEFMEKRIQRIKETERLKGEISERKSRETDLKLYQQQLEDSNVELQRLLEDLKHTQAQLIQSEKMAALGELVAGVAHEINTPLGIGVTSASFLRDETLDLLEKFKDNQLKRSQLDGYLVKAEGSSALILSNLKRTSKLVQSFKQVAVDQSIHNQRRFNLKAYLAEILVSLRPKLHGSKCEVTIEGDDHLILYSDPGAFSQIFSNFILNSLLHAYGKKDTGQITINIEATTGSILLTYADDGKGMAPENLDKIFNPFFTTKRNQGGTGLGMHIVYNIVTQHLQGTIRCISELNQGTKFEITLPNSLRVAS